MSIDTKSPANQEEAQIASDGSPTLSDRIAEGALSVPDALRLALNLAESLRKLHAERRVHGALTPSNVGLAPAGLQLLPPQIPSHGVTPYTAPEVLRGQPPDVRSDIFSFGAIVYEMITGRPPFAGVTHEALVDAVLNLPVAATGSGVLPALVTHCLAKDPAARWQRMQIVLLELRLLTVSARRPETPQRGMVAALVRDEVKRAMESQVGPRLDGQTKAITDCEQAITVVLHELQAHLSTIDARLAQAQESASRVEEVLPKLTVRVSCLEERLGRAEQTLESVGKQTAEFGENAGTQFRTLEQTVRSQADALESARRSVVQTDDLVERVVEALDSLHSIVLESRAS